MLSPLVTQRWMDPCGAASAAQHAAVLAHLQHASPHSALSPNEDASNASMAHSSAHVPDQQQQQQRWHDSGSGSSAAMQDTPLTQNESNTLARQMVCSSTEHSCNSTISSSNDSNADASSVSSAPSVSPPAASAFTYVAAQDQRMEDVASMQTAGKPFGQPLVPVASRAFAPVHPSSAHGHALGPMPIGSVPMGGVHYQYVPVVSLGMGGYHHGQMSSSSQQGNHGGPKQEQPHSNDSSPAQPSRTHHSPGMTPQTAPMSNGAAAKRGQGYSCHHCKTHKMPELLLFCSNQSKKGPGKKRCRKKVSWRSLGLSGGRIKGRESKRRRTRGCIKAFSHMYLSL